jgi:hypothetical protein
MTSRQYQKDHECRGSPLNRWPFKYGSGRSKEDMHRYPNVREDLMEGQTTPSCSANLAEIHFPVRRQLRLSR